MRRKRGQTVTKEKRRELWRAAKFLLISISAGLIQLGSFTLLKEAAGLPSWQAYLISLILSVLWNFTFNRRYTFQSAAHIPTAMGLVALFYLVFTPLSTWWGHALDRAGVNAYLIEGGTMAVNFVTEFIYQRFVVFRKSLDTNDRAKKQRGA